MNVTRTTIERLEITGAENLDPIRVYLEDIGPGKGRINIECYGKSWATYWGAMGRETLSEFFCTCDEHYIAGKLSDTPSEVFDPDGLKDQLKRSLISERKKRLVSRSAARARFNAIEYLSLPDNSNELWGMSQQMHELLGDEWWYSLPTKPNPDYTYLTKIIKTVQAALGGQAT